MSQVNNILMWFFNILSRVKQKIDTSKAHNK